MKTLKNGLKQENIDSTNLHTILTNYSHKDKVRIALYAAEDCFHLNPKKESQLCIDLVKKWLEDEKTVTKEELRTAATAANAAADAAANAAYAAASYTAAAYAAAYAAANAAYAAADAADAAYAAAYAAANAAANAAAYWAAAAFDEDKESKREEYRNYARLFAYEDLNFPYRKEARTFNLDNPTDLNIFLDFLTDNYPEALTYPREEYFKTKLAKEYLRIIYH